MKLYVTLLIMVALMVFAGLWMVDNARKSWENPGTRAQAMQEILKETAR